MNTNTGSDETSLQRLLERLVNGSISREEHDELQDQLRSSSTARQIYFNYLDLDTDLREILVSAAPLSSVTSSAKARSVKRWPVAVVAVAAAALLLASGFWWLPRHHDRAQLAADNQLPPTVPIEAPMETRGEVRLVQSAGAEFFRDLIPAIGDALQYHHEYALTAGMMELRFPDGAEVIVEAPTVWEIAAPDRLVLKQGTCSVHAPDGAEGFQVVTPHQEVVDLGTRFSVAVTEAGETDVQVAEGAAEIRSMDDPQASAIVLTEQQASRFAGSPAESPILHAYEPEKYIRHLPDRVVAYEGDRADGEQISRLRSVTVQRANKTQTYQVSDMIGAEITHFRAESNPHNLIVPVGDANVHDSVIAYDGHLNHGMINFGGSKEPLRADPMVKDDEVTQTRSTPGMAIRFRQSVINGPGPDVVFFDIQCVANPVGGDAFHVSPLHFAPGLRTHAIRNYDITMNSPAAQPVAAFNLLRFHRPCQSLNEVLGGESEPHVPPLQFWALAVGIDLSDLGYSSGAAVDGLFLQDAMDDDDTVDPVFIAGLPEARPGSELEDAQP